MPRNAPLDVGRVGQEVGATLWEREWDQNVSDEEETAPRRVQFFGVNDLPAGWNVPRVAEIAEQFDPSSAPTSVMDIIELHNVERYLHNIFLPRDYTESDHAVAMSQVGPMRSAVARFFAAVDDANCPAGERRGVRARASWCRRVGAPCFGRGAWTSLCVAIHASARRLASGVSRLAALAPQPPERRGSHQ